MEIHHGIKMSKRTLKRRLKLYGLSRRDSNITVQGLRAIIENEISGPGVLKGYRGMWNHLKCKYGIQMK